MLHFRLLLHTMVGGLGVMLLSLQGSLGPKMGGISSALANSLVLLTWLITQATFLLCLRQSKSQDALWGMSILATEILHIVVFFSRSLLTFFLSYEAVLLPLASLICREGTGGGRLRAAILFFMYTLGGSIPMLVATLYLMTGPGGALSAGTEVSLSLSMGVTETLAVWLAYALSFAIKTPLYPFVVWLIHAHAEAPLEGSMILAGIVLKLAIFGVSSFLITLLWRASVDTMNFTFSLCLTTLLVASGAMLQQVDLKGFVALSSVAHMGMSTLGILSLTADGSAGAWLLAIAHGLVSPGLFLITGGVLYRSFGSRLIYPFRGGGIVMPVVGLSFLLLSLANMATPLSPNWQSEAMILLALIQEHKLICSLSSLSIVLSALYSVWLYNRTVQGLWSPLTRIGLDASSIEVWILGLLVGTTLLCGCLTTGIIQVHSALVSSAIN